LANTVSFNHGFKSQFDANIIFLHQTSTATALRDIQDLVDKGILRRTEEGGHSTNYELVD